MNEQKLEQLFLQGEQTAEEEQDLILVDEVAIDEALKEMRRNLFDRQTKRMLLKVEDNISRRIRKVFQKIKNTPTACEDKSLLLACWVANVREKKKEVTITSLIRWWDANRNKTKEQCEEYLAGRCDIHAILEAYADVL